MATDPTKLSPCFEGLFAEIAAYTGDVDPAHEKILKDVINASETYVAKTGLMPILATSRQHSKVTTLAFLIDNFHRIVHIEERKTYCGVVVDSKVILGVIAAICKARGTVSHRYSGRNMWRSVAIDALVDVWVAAGHVKNEEQDKKQAKPRVAMLVDSVFEELRNPGETEATAQNQWPCPELPSTAVKSGTRPKRPLELPNQDQLPVAQAPRPQPRPEVHTPVAAEFDVAVKTE